MSSTGVPLANGTYRRSHSSTLDQLHPLRCPGRAAVLAEPLHSPLCEALSFEACPRAPSRERLGLLADRRMSTRLRRARLRHPNAGIEDIDSRHPRRLDKTLIHSLASALAARTPQRPHHRPHRRLPPSARIGGRQVLAPVPSHTTPAATASPPCPCASPGSCTNSPSPAATAATPSSSPPSPKPTSSSSTTSDSPSSTPTTAATSSSSSKTATPRAPLSSPASSLWLNGKLPGDPTLADAILDRLVHNAYTLELKGGSTRLLHKSEDPLFPRSNREQAPRKSVIPPLTPAGAGSAGAGIQGLLIQVDSRFLPAFAGMTGNDGPRRPLARAAYPHWQ